MSPSQPWQLDGRTVFITGAARGIGAAAARRLHAKGANVALVGLEPELLEENAAELGDGRTLALEADVTDYDALQRAVAATVQRFGAIDVAIANAGIAFSDALASAPMEHVERTLAVNLLGVWRTDRAVIEQIVARRGYLLNISSMAAATHAPLMGAYAAAKAGVEALTNALRMEVAPSGAAVGCAYFGFIDTDLVRAAFAEPSAQAMTGQMPAFMRNPAPLVKAIDAIERGVQRRSARVWAPRWVGAMLLARGLLQPLSERRMAADPARLQESIRLAASVADSEDPLLGVAMNAVHPHAPAANTGDTANTGNANATDGNANATDANANAANAADTNATDTNATAGGANGGGEPDAAATAAPTPRG